MSTTDTDYHLPGYTTEFGGITEREIVGRGRNMQTVDPGLVALVESRVRKSGVLEQLERWSAEDANPDGMGGRPAAISFRALLTAMLILTHEGAPLHMSRAATLLQHRLDDQSRTLLGVSKPATAFATHTAINARWYNNTVRAFHRIIRLVDPYPQERYTSKTHTQIQRILKEHDAERADKYKARLDHFTRVMLNMSFMEQPRQIRRASKQMDVSFDQTYVGTPTTKGYSKKHLNARVRAEKGADLGQLAPGPVDAFAGWHAKSGKGERNDHQKGEIDQTAPGRGEYTNYDWGWVANLAVRVDSEAPGSKRFPGLVVAASLSIPNMEVAEEATRLLQTAATIDPTLTPGVADADKQYFANSKSFRLLVPALEVGFTPSTDYRTDRMGVKGGDHGALFVEGEAYCPSTPKEYLEATPMYLADNIDRPTYRARLEERENYRLHVKEKAKTPAGKVMLRCPALGKSPTVTCPLRELMVGAAIKARPEVKPEEIEEEFLDTICTKHSAAFDLTEMQSPPQAFDYGSEEWAQFHDHARNSIESENGQLKTSGNDDIETAGRRKVRGIAAAQVMITMLLVNHNIRKIAAFFSDKEKEKARTTPRIPLLRRRDRVWANRYTKTTGNGDLTIPRGVAAHTLKAHEQTSRPLAIPLRT
jgi:hypothetical protein